MQLKLSKKLLFAALISAAALLSSAEPAATKPAAEYKSAFKAPLEMTGYATTVQLTPEFSKRLKKLAGKEAEIAYELDLEATEDGQFAGAKFRIYTADKKDFMQDLITWKTPVSKEPAKLSGKCKVKIPENFARATILFYNYNTKGTLRVKSIRLSAY